MKAKLFAGALSLLGAGLFIVSLQIETPFSYDPLGPKPFPMAVSIGLLTLPLLIIFIPQPQVVHVKIQSRVVKLVLILFFYLLSFEFLGFMLSTTISGYFIARIIGSSRMQGLLTGLIISILFYGIFRLWLDARLPLGQIYNVVGA
ncbi:MAG: tripartite tricarboxylate transporter TctB family protein [Proteobacteria bacterium]|nr:tripartite tricarboxylate transporter TctB family protein [Pseudomonadota bacterium]